MVLISILTPSWNRVQGLNRLFDSLKIQSSLDFQWLVGVDGSEDSSLSRLVELQQRSPFSIHIVHSSKRVGKAFLDNRLLELVNTPFYIPCDSDDWMLPHSIAAFCSLIDSFGSVDKTPDMIIAKNISVTGAPITCALPFQEGCQPAIDALSKVNGDATIVHKTSRFSSQRHLEVDFVVTESCFYQRLLPDCSAYLFNNIVKVMDRTDPLSISYSRGIKYCRGSAYSLRASIGLATKPPSLREISLLARYVFNGEMSLSFLLRSFRSQRHQSWLVAFGIMVGYVLSLRDTFLGGLIKTHRSFEANVGTTHIKYYPPC